MAASKKMATKATTEPAVEATPVATAPAPAPVAQPQKREYTDNDKIQCLSITPGEYLFEGEKSQTMYRWIDAGIREDMRYDDLTSAIRTRKACIFKPRIVIEDKEFLAEYPELQRLYDSMYSKDDLGEILKLDAGRMTQVINGLPEGAKDAIRSLAVKAIENGTLDSVARVRALDTIFGTDMLLKLAQ